MKSALAPIALATAVATLSACSIQVVDDAHSAPAHNVWRCTNVAWLEPGKPVIHLTVNGRELTFLVDTGAEYDGWIKPEVARELGMAVVGTVPSDGPDDPTAGLLFFGATTVRLGSLDMGPRRFGELTLVGGSAQPFDGIVGSGMFAGLQAVFDYERGVLQATDLNLVKGNVEPFQWGAPLVTLHIGRKPAPVIVDTGNLASKLFVTAEVAKTLPLVGEPVRKGTAHTVAGPLDVMEAGLADPVRFGTTVLPITTVRWPGAFETGQLGSRGLAGQTLRIDYRTHRVSIAPETTAPQCPVGG